MTQAQFHFRLEEREGEAHKDIAALLTNCMKLEQRLKWRLKEFDPDATVKWENTGDGEAFSIECDLNPGELIKEILDAIEAHGLLDRASRITAQ